MISGPKFVNIKLFFPFLIQMLTSPNGLSLLMHQHSQYLFPLTNPKDHILLKSFLINKNLVFNWNISSSLFIFSMNASI
jgi:hypothetical protein